MDVFTSNLSYDDFEDIYLVTQLMESDLSEVVRTQKLTDEHVQFLIYQILRGLKVKMYAKLLMMIIILKFCFVVLAFSWDSSSSMLLSVLVRKLFIFVFFTRT